MGRQESNEEFERWERQRDHQLTIAEWGEMLWRQGAAWRSWPCPFPVHFLDRMHRLRVYAWRATRRVDLFHDDDD